MGHNLHPIIVGLNVRPDANVSGQVVGIEGGGTIGIGITLAAWALDRH